MVLFNKTVKDVFFFIRNSIFLEACKMDEFAGMIWNYYLKFIVIIVVHSFG